MLVSAELWKSTSPLSEDVPRSFLLASTAAKKSLMSWQLRQSLFAGSYGDRDAHSPT
jgi:hypothetical protein